MKVATLTPTVGKMRDEIDRVFDRFFTAPFLGEPLAFPLEPMREYGAEWMPVLDLAETPKEYVIRLEAPGIHKENLDINLTGNVLKITGRKEAVQELAEIRGMIETHLTTVRKTFAGT